MNNFKPFANEQDNLSIDELTVENRVDKISIYGSLDITKDIQGLVSARILLSVLGSAVVELEALEKNNLLPEKITTSQPVVIKNPFA